MSRFEWLTSGPTDADMRRLDQSLRRGYSLPGSTEVMDEHDVVCPSCGVVVRTVWALPSSTTQLESCARCSGEVE